jgi:3'-phosphoadenosine 5'-phosphosulfate sulfotransferase (PAPS reductase)/FAD synthetase
MENITTFNFKELNKFDKIFCLVSGGIDSTYLLEMCYQECDNIKVYPVNCFNPYEQSTTLDIIQTKPNFTRISPDSNCNYGQILNRAFMKLPESRVMKSYSKKIFECCYFIKHKAFMNDPLFQQPNTVVISGIKYNDGMQRRMFLKSLVDGVERTKGALIKDYPTFYHLHKSGQLYCYPFRDFKERQLPDHIINELKVKYPNLTHSGCRICPVLVRFEKKIRKEKNPFDLERLELSIAYAKNLNVY